MTPDERLAAIRAIHDSPLRIMLAVTGGGMLALSDLLSMRTALTSKSLHTEGTNRLCDPIS